MSVSARNQLTGVVTSVQEGAVNNEVVLELDGGESLTTVITRASSRAMGLAPGKPVLALVKAPWVVLASSDNVYIFSARNQFQGTVTSVNRGAVNTTVNLVTDSGLALTSSITNESVDLMHIEIGVKLNALIKASSIILAMKN